MEVQISKFSGLFTVGHGHSSDAVKELSDFDGSILENLKSALSFVRKGFSVLGEKHDLFFSVFGKNLERSRMLDILVREDLPRSIFSLDLV